MMKIETTRRWYNQASTTSILYTDDYKEEKNESAG